MDLSLHALLIKKIFRENTKRVMSNVIMKIWCILKSQIYLRDIFLKASGRQV